MRSVGGVRGRAGVQACKRACPCCGDRLPNAQWGCAHCAPDSCRTWNSTSCPISSSVCGMRDDTPPCCWSVDVAPCPLRAWRGGGCTHAWVRQTVRVLLGRTAQHARAFARGFPPFTPFTHPATGHATTERLCALLLTVRRWALVHARAHGCAQPPAQGCRGMLGRRCMARGCGGCLSLPHHGLERECGASVHHGLITEARGTGTHFKC